MDNVFSLLWLVPALPLAGFVILTVLIGSLSRRNVSVIGVGSVGAAAVVTGAIATVFITAPPPLNHSTQTLWVWMNTSGFSPTVSFHLDALSLIMIVVITFVAALIHLYSTEFMWEDDGYQRFFAYMNLFVASMLLLVLADNLLLLYLGWEGVGLCSYLLIGFWYQDPANGRAAQKAFIVTRIGDTAFAIGLFLLFRDLGTLNIQELLMRAQQQWPVGTTAVVVAAALLLGGAVGKSAQLPLQTWLPDAMAGPTPVSALIHAATMVTAGVYLIARLHTLYELAPTVQFAVGVIGALTLLLAAFSALVQRDIKRVLAYSTMSQIGYMFLALGVGAWSAALFHFMTHAFFKALLFLGAGATILVLHHEHDIFRMGGLRRHLPLTFWTFLIGAASLAGLPLVTAGFYSKDLILWETWASAHGNGWLWGAGVLGAFLTALYSFRLVLYVFFGELKTMPHGRLGFAMRLPLMTLAALALAAGFLETPANLGGLSFFRPIVETVLPATPLHEDALHAELAVQLTVMLVAVLGMAVAYVVFQHRRALAQRIADNGLVASLSRWWLEGWWFDRVYDVLLVRPFLWLAHINRHDVIDRVYSGIAAFNRLAFEALRITQTGRVRWYAAMMAGGSAVMIGLALFA